MSSILDLIPEPEDTTMFDPRIDDAKDWFNSMSLTEAKVLAHTMACHAASLRFTIEGKQLVPLSKVIDRSWLEITSYFISEVPKHKDSLK